jgi:hypothetical protein
MSLSWTHKRVFPKNDFSPCILRDKAPGPRKCTCITRGLQVAICPPLSKRISLRTSGCRSPTWPNWYSTIIFQGVLSVYKINPTDGQLIAVVSCMKYCQMVWNFTKMREFSCFSWVWFTPCECVNFKIFAWISWISRFLSKPCEFLHFKKEPEKSQPIFFKPHYSLPYCYLFWFFSLLGICHCGIPNDLIVWTPTPRPSTLLGLLRMDCL